MHSYQKYVIGVGAIFILAIFVLPFSAAALVCGLDWRLPKVGPFPEGGFDEKGRVLYTEKIGRLNLGSGDSAEEIPLYIKFSPKYQSASPYLGRGWMLPLLDSRIVQLSEREFLAEMPDGWTRIFYRSNANSSILQEGGGWKGEIKEDVITVWASCGWKLVFKSGQLVSLTTPNNHRLDYDFRGDKVVAVKGAGKDILQVELNHSTGEVIGLSYGVNQHIDIEQGDKPQVQTIAGQNVVGDIERSLKKLVLNGAAYTYTFAVNDALNPTLKIESPDANPRTIAWDPANSQILSDNDWTYDISFPAQGAFAKIERTDSLGRSEHWFDDGTKGTAIKRRASGDQVTTKYFVSGPLAGLIRYYKIERANGNVLERKISYDANGKHLFRYGESGGRWDYKYQHGKIASITKGQEIVFSQTLDSKGRLLEARLRDRHSRFVYPDDNEFRVLLAKIPESHERIGEMLSKIAMIEIVTNRNGLVFMNVLGAFNERLSSVAASAADVIP